MEHYAAIVGSMTGQNGEKSSRMVPQRWGDTLQASVLPSLGARMLPLSFEVLG